MKHPYITVLDSILTKAEEEDHGKYLRAMERKTKLHNFTVNEDGSVEATAVGEVSGSLYRVKIDLGNQVRNCTCPAHKHYPGPCKHAIALCSLTRDFFTLLS